ncbi:MAG TPA: acyl-CoA synthetase, partial [Nitrospiraceae bacterium]|nr:acyl-CoA synthetase [Nitrospiraceae bacterium]
AISHQLSALTYPLVAKVSSVKIASKSDVGGIRLGIKNYDELTKAVSELLEIENAEGVLVEEMAPEGIEVIIGGVTDKQFGPIVMFGLGGVFVELFKDIAFALAPLKEEDALWLIKQVKGYKLLEGFRGKPAVDKDALITTILAVSEIVSAGDVEEIDLNPVTLYPKGAMVLDAKMRGASASPSTPLHS